MTSAPLTDEQAHQVYTWVDKHALSRPKRNIARDFADGVCVAEILRHYFPQFVEIHNYVPSFSQKQKVENWQTMNSKVFRKLNLQVDPQDLKDISNAVPGAIERFLLVLLEKIPLVQEKLQARAQQQVHGGNNSSSRGRSTSALGQHQQQPQQQQQQQQQPNSSRGPSPSARGISSLSQQQQQLGASSGSNSGLSINDAAKDHEISHLRDSVRLLTAKIKQMDELLKLRDSKIRDLQDRIVELTS